jgi:hypothetical protein
MSGFSDRDRLVDVSGNFERVRVMPGRFPVPAAVCLLSIVFGVLVTSCDEAKPPTSPPPPGGGPPPSAVLRIELTTPQELAPGQPVQLTAHTIKSDGSREDVTSRAQWTSNAPDILNVSPSGLATGREIGESTVSARLDGRSAAAVVYVLPAGTFRLNGRTHEFGTTLPGTSIEVLEGIGAGTKTVSGQDGSYRIFGVSGPIRLQVKKDGYVNRLENISVESHTARDFALESQAGYEGYTGTYTLIVTAVAPCTGPFPDEARRRVYTAHMRQDRGTLRVTLADADFILTSGFGNAFSGQAVRGGVIFELRRFNFYYYYYVPREYQVVERLTPTSALVVHGLGEGGGPPSHLRGRLGAIAITNRVTAPHDPFVASCNAEFEMVRR